MKKYKVGYTQGVFDMFHVGHLNLLNNAKAQCEILIVGVNSDELVKQYKSKTPVIPQEQRRLIVENIKAVDKAVIVETLDKTVQLQNFGFDAVFIGSDWKGNDRWEKTKKELSLLGVDVIFLPYTDGICSTELAEKEHKRVDE